MDYAHLGRTGLEVSRLCLGTMNFGGPESASWSHALMDQALDAGINFFDTANVYGGGGGTETLLGEWFAQGNGRRERVVLATKVYGKTGDAPNMRGLSARHIRRSCEDSLRRLQTDYIDLYQMHHIDRETPWDEIWQAMEQLVREGKILYVGSSNFAGWHIAQANEAARQRRFLGLVSEQCKYNLMLRTAEMEVIPACRAYGVGVIPWSPLADGILGGALQDPGEGRRSESRVRHLVEENRERLEAYEALCREMGEPPATVALAWLLTRSGLTAPIIGPRKPEQLQQSLHAVEIRLPKDVLDRLDGLFPGPGPAPEAFAW